MKKTPKGLYMIFVKDDKDCFMGKVVGLTKTSALVNLWNFVVGGIDEDSVSQLLLQDFNEFISFDDLEEMDKYFANRHWNLILSKDIQMGEIK